MKLLLTGLQKVLSLKGVPNEISKERNMKKLTKRSVLMTILLVTGLVCMMSLLHGCGSEEAAATKFTIVGSGI